MNERQKWQQLFMHFIVLVKDKVAIVADRRLPHSKCQTVVGNVAVLVLDKNSNYILLAGTICSDLPTVYVPGAFTCSGCRRRRRRNSLHIMIFIVRDQRLHRHCYTITTTTLTIQLVRLSIRLLSAVPCHCLCHHWVV